jgi:hypothetical protein
MRLKPPIYQRFKRRLKSKWLSLTCEIRTDSLRAAADNAECDVPVAYGLYKFMRLFCTTAAITHGWTRREITRAAGEKREKPQ